MAIAFMVDATGLKAKLARAKRVMSLRGLLRAIGLRQLGWINQNFESQGALVGGWKPLSPNTIAGRRKGPRARPDMILQDIGHLKASFVSGKPGNVFDVEHFSVTVGTNIKHAEFHEEGRGPYVIKPRKAGGLLKFITVYGWRSAREVNHPGIPRRPMLPPEAAAKANAVSVIEGELAKIERKNA